MPSQFKEVLNETSDSIDSLEKKIEGLVEEFTEDSAELWADVKKNLAAVSEKLKTAANDLDAQTDEAELQAHLGAMEAHDRFNNIKDTVDQFTDEVSAKAKTGMDTAELRAHLATMDAKDFWEESGEALSKEFNESSEKVKQVTLDATSEIKDYFASLTQVFSDKTDGKA